MTRTSFTREKGRRLFFLCLILTVIYIWSNVWTSLEGFEENQPSDILADFRKELISQAGGGSCAQILEDCGYSNPYYNNPHAGRILANAIRGKNISFRFDERIETDNGFHSYYIISANEKRVARFAIGTEETYSLLKLPIYKIISIEGLVSADIAVQDPEGIGVADVEFSSLNPVESGFCFSDLRTLAENDPDIIIPDFYIYHLDGMFDTPDIYTLENEGSDSEIFSTVVKDGKIVVGSSVLKSSESDIYAVFEEVWQKYGLYLTGDLNWAGFKGHVMSTAPIFSNMEGWGEELAQQQTSTEFTDLLATGSMRWNGRLVSISMKGTMILHVPGGDKSYDLDNTFYLYYCDDSVWRVCEIIERGYGREEHK